MCMHGFVMVEYRFVYDIPIVNKVCLYSVYRGTGFIYSEFTLLLYILSVLYHEMNEPSVS